MLLAVSWKLYIVRGGPYEKGFDRKEKRKRIFHTVYSHKCGDEGKCMD